MSLRHITEDHEQYLYIQYLGKVMYERASLSGIHRMKALWGELTQGEREKWFHLAIYVVKEVSERKENCNLQEGNGNISQCNHADCTLTTSCK